MAARRENQQSDLRVKGLNLLTFCLCSPDYLCFHFFFQVNFLNFYRFPILISIVAYCLFENQLNRELKKSQQGVIHLEMYTQVVMRNCGI